MRRRWRASPPWKFPPQPCPAISTSTIPAGRDARRIPISAVEIPTSAVPGYFDIYNPGGPGRTPNPNTIYTRPALPQLQPVFVSLDHPRTVSYAEQAFERYDLDDNLAVVFRLHDPNGPDRFTSSSIE